MSTWPKVPWPAVDPAQAFLSATAVPLDQVGLPPWWQPGEGWRSPARIPLGEVPPGRMPLGQALAERRTAATFHPGVSLPRRDLEFLLERGAGETVGRTTVGPRRAAPSPGARYPIGIAVIALRIHGLEPGIYYFDPAERCLWHVRSGPYGDVLPALTLGQPALRDAAAVLALFGDYARVWPRYGVRGYRYMLFECGHLAQNMYLLAAAQELDIKAVGGFADVGLDRLLGLDGWQFRTLYLLAIGARRDGRDAP
jgi:SagB-type dehydrogenase family enzyme